MDFQSVAKDIIKESISNALFVDDNAWELYKGKSKIPRIRLEHDRSRELYKDFKSHHCLLHIAKFTRSGWKRDRKFNLNNKDLLILDWQLVGDDHGDALKILDLSVLKKSIHFCCIYTQSSLEEVKNELNRYFLGNISGQKINDIRALFEGTDLDDYWNLDLQDADWKIFEEFCNNIVNAREVDVNSEIDSFRNEYNLSLELIEQLKTIDTTVKASFVKLKTALGSDVSPFSNIQGSDLIFRASKVDDNTFYINHTIVKLFAKGNVGGDQLYSAFLDSIMNERNIFLTLMGLEMRNRFRESSAFIGKDLDNISEEAFFYHKKFNLEHPELFIDFLRDLLKDQVASFLYEKDLKIFNVLQEYYDSNDGEARQAQFLHSDNAGIFLTEVFRLNSFYNRLNINHRKINDTLRFGDVFYANSDNIDEFYMCITPHCDCLTPSKLKNQFWFVKGQKVEETTAAKNRVLKGADGRHISFVQFESAITCIYWESGSLECKPFAFHVPNNKLLDGKLTVYFNGISRSFTFVDSIKENYAQRISNHAAGYALRVGIDFVKK